jgi:hypothetical protein
MVLVRREDGACRRVCVARRGFPSREALAPVRGYYEEFGGVFASYVYVEGNVLAQTDGDVPEDRADRYREVLQET